MDAACLRVRLALKAGFDPNQPRMPAGNPDGGQWTRIGGDGSVAAETIPIGSSTRRRGYPIDLLEEEQNGGHTIAAHVGKSAQHLLARVRAGRAFFGFATVALRRDGSFPSLEAANKLVNATIAQNQSVVELVASGILDEEFITATFPSRTGIEAYRPGERASPYLRDTYGVGVVIVHDPNASNGFRVITAYPRND